jgi:hypothetical protein
MLSSLVPANAQNCIGFYQALEAMHKRGSYIVQAQIPSAVTSAELPNTTARMSYHDESSRAMQSAILKES